MPKHDPQAAVFEAEYGRATERELRRLLAATDFGFESLELMDAAELRREELGDPIDADCPAVAVVGCCPRHGVADLWPATLSGTERICEANVIALRAQGLERSGISAHEGIDRPMGLLDDGGETLRLSHGANITQPAGRAKIARGVHTNV